MNREVFSLGAFPSLPRRGGRSQAMFRNAFWNRSCGWPPRLRRFGGFATFLLMPQPPLLCKEGKVP